MAKKSKFQTETGEQIAQLIESGVADKDLTAIASTIKVRRRTRRENTVKFNIGELVEIVDNGNLPKYLLGAVIEVNEDSYPPDATYSYFTIGTIRLVPEHNRRVGLRFKEGQKIYIDNAKCACRPLDNSKYVEEFKAIRSKYRKD